MEEPTLGWGAVDAIEPDPIPGIDEWIGPNPYVEVHGSAFPNIASNNIPVAKSASIPYGSWATELASGAEGNSPPRIPCGA
jgi:hypothetical protein